MHELFTGGCALGTTGSNFEPSWGVLDTYWRGLVTQNFTWDLLQLTCSYINISYIFYVISYPSIPGREYVRKTQVWEGLQCWKEAGLGVWHGLQVDITLGYYGHTINPRITKRLFVRVCPRDKQGNYKRTKPALYPIILANVELGTTVCAHTYMHVLYSYTSVQLYTDGWLAYRRLSTIGYHHRLSIIHYCTLLHLISLHHHTLHYTTHNCIAQHHITTYSTLNT